MGYEAEIADGNKLANKRMRLNPTVLADFHVALNFYEWADETIVSDLTFIEIHGLYDSDVLPKNHFPDLYFFYDWSIFHISPGHMVISLLRPYRFFR